MWHVRDDPELDTNVESDNGNVCLERDTGQHLDGILKSVKVDAHRSFSIGSLAWTITSNGMRCQK